MTLFIPPGNKVRTDDAECLAALVRCWESNGDRNTQKQLQHVENEIENQNIDKDDIKLEITPAFGLRSQRGDLKDPSKFFLPPVRHWLKLWETWRMLLQEMPPSSGPYFSCEEDSAINPKTIYSFARGFIATQYCSQETGILVYEPSLPNLGGINDKP